MDESDKIDYDYSALTALGLSKEQTVSTVPMADTETMQLVAPSAPTLPGQQQPNQQTHPTRRRTESQPITWGPFQYTQPTTKQSKIWAAVFASLAIFILVLLVVMLFTTGLTATQTNRHAELPEYSNTGIAAVFCGLSAAVMLLAATILTFMMYIYAKTEDSTLPIFAVLQIIVLLITIALMIASAVCAGVANSTAPSLPDRHVMSTYALMIVNVAVGIPFTLLIVIITTTLLFWRHKANCLCIGDIED
jgi:hypothetical protein